MSRLDTDDVARRLREVRERIAAAAAGRTRDVTVVAVTKGHDVWAVDAARDAGLRDIGENYAAELLQKHSSASAGKPVLRWHFLGRVQRNKVKALAGAVDLWQGVDRLVAGQEIARRAPAAAVLVQVNVSGEPAKNGCRFEEAPALVAGLGDLGLDVRGLMAVGPATGDPRRAYGRLNALADRLDLTERSMGMSADLETAVEEGATMVRIGQALFGPRKVRTGDADLRR